MFQERAWSAAHGSGDSSLHWVGNSSLTGDRRRAENLRNARTAAGRARRGRGPSFSEVWTGRVERAGFGDGRGYVKIRAKVLERAEHTVKIGLVGTEQRIQRRVHLRVAMNQTTTVHTQGRGGPVVVDEVLDISEGCSRLRPGRLRRYDDSEATRDRGAKVLSDRPV